MTAVIVGVPAAVEAAPRARLAPGAVGVGAFALSFAGSWVPSVWSDEAATISAATRAPGELLRLVDHVDLVHGLYYALMHVWFGVVGVSEMTLRLPSALAVGLAAAGMVVLGEILGGIRTGLLTGVLFAVLPRVTWMGTEGRSAAMATTAAVWLTVLLVTASRRRKVWWWALYGLAAAASVVLWIFLALLVVAHGVSLLTARSSRPVLLGWGAGVLGASLAAGPFVMRARGQSAQVGWIATPGPGTAKSVLVDQWFGTDGWPCLPLAALCWLGIASTVLVAVRRSRAAAAPRLSPLAVALPWMLLPPAVIVGYSIVGNPVYAAKYVAFGAPAVALTLGAGLALVRAGRRQVSALVVVAALAVPAYLSERSPAGKDGSDWGEVAQVVAAQRKGGDAVVYGDLYDEGGGIRAPGRAVAVAYPAALGPLADVTRGTSAGALGSLWDETLPLVQVQDSLRGADRVWVVYDHTRSFATGGGAEYKQLSDLGFGVSREWTGRKTDLFLLTR